MQLCQYFPETEGPNDWIRHPFKAMPTSLSVADQKSLIEIATDGFLKVEYAQKTLADFWIVLCTENPALAKCCQD